MKTIRTVAVIALLVLLTGISAFEARRAARFGDQRQELARQLELLTRRADQLRQERDMTAAALKNLQERFAQLDHNRAELMRLRGQVGLLLNEKRELLSQMESSGSLTHNAVRNLALKVDAVKRCFAEQPETKIPEMGLLTEAEWLEAVQDENFESEEGLRRTMSRIRAKAKNKFGTLLHHALRAYVDSHEGQLPTALYQVAPYFQTLMGKEVFARWKLTRTGSVEEVGDSFFIKESAPVDAVYDTLYEFSLGGITARNASHVLIEEAMAAYATANRGQRPPTAEDLRPYLNTPVDEALLGAMFQNPVPQ